MKPGVVSDFISWGKLHTGSRCRFIDYRANLAGGRAPLGKGAADLSIPVILNVPHCAPTT
jgi:hypothetical protein